MRDFSGSSIPLVCDIYLFQFLRAKCDAFPPMTAIPRWRSGCHRRGRYSETAFGHDGQPLSGKLEDEKDEFDDIREQL